MKHFFPFLILLSTLIPASSFGQGKPNFVGEWYQRISQGKSPVRADVFSKKQSDFAKTKRYNLKANINQLNSIMNTKPEVVTLIIPYGDKSYTLNLAKVEVTADQFNVRTSEGGQVNHDKGVQYRGIVDNNPAHIASLSLTKTDKSAYFSTDEGNFTVIREGVDFIAYNDEMMELPATIMCVTPDITYPITIDRNVISGIGCKTVNVYFECDNAFYVSKGSVAALTDYVIGFFNQVATLYANEDIAIQVSEIFAWTTPDPYVSMTTPSTIMNSFKANRGTNYNGNIAHFLTTRNVGGGIAYVNTLCNKAYSYGVSRIYTTYSNFPTYSWTVNVVAHELGHNFGSAHTQSCSWTGGPIDNCMPPEGTCSPGPAPINGGTIMSYCHTTSVGINFNNGFGLLPGNLMRTNVQNAACLPAGTSATPPTSLSATNISTNSVTLNWAAVLGGGNYTVQYKLATATTWTSGGSTTATSLNLTGLTANSAYQWSVKSDCSAFATTATFTTTGTSGCTAPTQLSSSSLTQTGATLSWGSVSGATGYTVQYKTSAATTWTTINATTNSLSLTGLTAGTTYNWQVKASCSSGYSLQSSFTTTTSTGCAAPAQLASSAVTQTGATVSWAAVSGATGYTLQYKTSSATTWTSVAVTTTSRALTGLVAATNYVWQVKANCSAYSSQASFTTASTSGCAAPGQLTSAGITQTGATLSWGAVGGATSYTLQYRRSTVSTWTSVSVSTTSRALTGLTAGASYVWQVKASCSAYSGQASFTTASSTGTGCTVPTNLSVTSITTNAATLNWIGSSNAVSYSIRYKPVGFSGWTIRNSVTGSSLRITNLMGKRMYEWAINVKCSNGTTSSLSGLNRFTTL
jgi:hypothetical protein